MYRYLLHNCISSIFLELTPGLALLEIQSRTVIQLELTPFVNIYFLDWMFVRISKHRQHLNIPFHL